MSTDFATRLRVISSERKLKRADVARDARLSPAVYGRYERGERTPPVDSARTIADAFDVSLDCLVGEGINAAFDKRTVKRLQEIEQMEPEEKTSVFRIIDAVIRDYKTRKAYA